MTNLIPPSDTAAERGLLGGVLRDPEIFTTIRGIVAESAFYQDAHQRIFAAMARLADSSRPIDLVTVAGELTATNSFAEIGGPVYLAEIWEVVATGANAEYYARTVRECAAVRHLIRVCTELLREGYSRSMSAEELIAMAERHIFAVAQNFTQSRDNVRLIGEVMREVLEDLDERIGSGGALAGLSSGYTDLDDLLGGFRPGELIVLGARPSVGKTALALNILTRAAKRGAPVFFASLEMPAKELAGRMLAMGSGVAMYRITRGTHIDGNEIERLAFTASPNGLGGCGMYIDDAADQTAARLASTARRIVSQHGVQLVVVDYLQLMRPENSKENRTQQVGALALRMKHMARDCNIPVILLSQLNRESEHAGRRPRLSDLRESGDIEAHADRVLLLHRESDLATDAADWPIEVIVAKNRNGPIGDVRLLYQRSVMRFENYAPEPIGYRP